jgi:hypothetical protein
MSYTGHKHTLEAKARISASLKARWAAIKEAQEHVAIHTVELRCNKVPFLTESRRKLVRWIIGANGCPVK